MKSACGATVVGNSLPIRRAGIGEIESLEHVVQAAPDHGEIDRAAIHVVADGTRALRCCSHSA